MNRQQRGAALAVTLILLAGLGSLALTAAAAAVAALALAGHQQSAQQAFEAAEAGIAHALSRAAVTRSAGTITVTVHDRDAASPATFESRIEAVESPGALPAGFSVGEHDGAFGARHFYAVADGRAGRGAAVRIEQGFYLVGPGGGS
jgi:voltage-gated potassium channel Kch